MAHKKKSKIKVFETTIKEYASSSSAHGIAYIFEPHRLGLERLFWILIVSIALIFRYVH